MSVFSSLPHIILTSPHLLSSFNSLPASRRRSSMAMLPLRAAYIHEARRSANYQPNSWNYDYLESLSTNDFKKKKNIEEREKMIAEVKAVLNDSSMDLFRRLELVDAVDRLGLKRHFQEEIKACVRFVHSHKTDIDTGDLHATAVRFRILRQHGYFISQDVFNKFKDQHGNIRKVFAKDIKELMSLYEASFLEFRGDDTLQKIRAFAIQQLKEQMSYYPPKQAKEVEKALDLPLQWRFPRLEARWSIEAYDHHLSHPSLIKLAKLDYNILQACYKDEIKSLVRWWKKLELLKKLPYTRDRLMEHYLWILGLVEEPEYSLYRVMETKILTLVTALDDTYDVYGTLQELQLFTHLIDGWEINGIDRLPEPMRHCFLDIYDTSNEVSDSTFKEKGFHIIPYLSKSWARLCNTYLKEAKWSHERYKPSLSEYLETSIVSIGTQFMLLDCYLLTTSSISNEAVQYIDNLPNLLRCAATIIRLSNDLASSKDEMAHGDTSKALECYMNENGVSEEVARDHIEGLIMETFTNMNEEYYLNCPQYPVTISEPYLGANFNLARTSQFFYSSKKNWHDKPEQEMMDHMMQLLINPIDE